MALTERTSHETALPLVRRCLRDGTPIPATLRTARPLSRPLLHYDHVGERDWMEFGDQDDDGSDEEADGAVALEDLLLNEDRDLTDEELARIYAK